MRRFHVGNLILLVLIPFCFVAPAPAVTPDRELLSLVPPTAQSVAGMIASQHGTQPSGFLLITRNNLTDLNDFIALSGVDGSRVIDQVIMIASDDGGGALVEHSILAKGRFDQGLIYKSVQSAGAEPIRYHSIAVLEVQPFARERDSFHDVRWLAMLGSNLAVFGTRGIVQQELDRYLGHSAADPNLEQRLAHLGRDDATWCVATLPHDNREIQDAFKMLDSRIAELLQPGDTLEFGTRYGRRVEFEYEVGMGSSPRPEAVSRTLMQASIGPQTRADFALPAAELTRSDGGVRGVLKISRARYEAWTAAVQGTKTEPGAASDPAKR